ncbi:hypothetical protein FI667_g16679, partial [Globisporangium splendens]
MEDAKPSAEPVAVTLFPSDYETVEMITDQGVEILQQLSVAEFTDAQLFMHSIQELEKARLERKKKKQKVTSAGSLSPAQKDTATAASSSGGVKENGVSKETADGDGDELMLGEAVNGIEANGAQQDEGAAVKVDGDAEGLAEADEEEEDVIDPRIHYRPMVAELQAAVAELHQLINSIDLIRRREFMEEMRCLRDNTAPKKEDLEYLIESKSTQVKESSSILLAGVDNLANTVEKESVFFQGITHLLRKWKICAPIHGNIPKPFRAGEPLAVDCSFMSAGSTFTPQTRSIADLSFAELQLSAVESGKVGSYTLPSPQMIKMSKAELERLGNTPEDIKILDERNASVLKAVQFSVFCEELFQTLMQEALRNTSNWTDTAYSINNYAAKKHRADESAGAGSISVLQVLDDEIQLRVNEKYHLTVKLVDVSTLTSPESAADPDSDMADVKQEGSQIPNGTAHPASTSRGGYSGSMTEEQFLTETSRYSLLLLEQEIRHRHGRKDISRTLLYTGTDSLPNNTSGMNSSTHQSESEKQDTSVGTLATVLNVVAHNLLKHEVTRYLDELSATLAFQNMQSSSSGRVLEDALLQPICDSVRGIYVSPRWKICAHDSTLSAFDLSIGKNFTTEVLIAGTRIRFEDGPVSVREVSGLEGLKEFVEKTVCTQVAYALHRDALSFGLKQATMDLDRASVRLFSAKEWNGTCMGDGRVSDTKAVGSIYFEPFFQVDGSISINCMLQAVNASNVLDISVLTKSSSGDVCNVDWKRIPGQSDVGKLVWLLQKTGILSDMFTSRESIANGASN